MCINCIAIAKGDIAGSKTITSFYLQPLQRYKFLLTYGNIILFFYSGTISSIVTIQGLSFNSKNSISIDEGMPSDVALVCFFQSFIVILVDFCFVRAQLSLVCRITPSSIIFSSCCNWFANGEPIERHSSIILCFDIIYKGCTFSL